MSLTLVAWFSGLQSGLSPEDEEVKRRLVKFCPRAYSELIRSDIPRPYGAEPARLLVLRPSPPSIPCLEVFFVFCFGASYHKAHSRRALIPPRGSSKEEKERKAKNSGFP